LKGLAFVSEPLLVGIIYVVRLSVAGVIEIFYPYCSVGGLIIVEGIGLGLGSLGLSFLF
jgi:hypothetical protein